MMYNPFETNRQVEKKIRKRYILSCSICPPHRMENAGGGTTKRKHIRKKIDILNILRT